MCRRYQGLGIWILGFGFGLILCCWMESEVLRICFGAASIAAGILLVQKK